MATALPNSCVLHIGEVAGEVWRILSKNGPLSLAKLAKEVDEPRDTVMQALGWLAREGKVKIDDEGRNRIVSLAE
jgi:hypothetical protein